MGIWKPGAILSTFLLIQNHFRKKKKSLKEIPYTALGFFLLLQKISVCLYYGRNEDTNLWMLEIVF